MKLVELKELFDIKNGHGLELLNCDESHEALGVPFVSRSSANNGISAHIYELDDVEPLPAHCISVALGGSVLSSFYQSRPFYSAFHIQCLYPKVELTENEMLYYCAAIEANKYRYNYGRQANKTLKSIKVPSIENIPNSVNHFTTTKILSVLPASCKTEILRTALWKTFELQNIFKVVKGKRLTKEDMDDGDIRFIGSTEYNNGITNYVANDEHVHDGNLITVAYNGSVAESFYQTEPFVASDDINILKPLNFKLNPYIAMFLITLLDREKYRYSYGRKWHKNKMEKSSIKLPATPNGQPDWGFMERYIKSLPYSSNL